MRIGPSGAPFALDYGAALAMGQAMDADMGLLADVLQGVEAAILGRGVDGDVEFMDHAGAGEV